MLSMWEITGGPWYCMFLCYFPQLQDTVEDWRSELLHALVEVYQHERLVLEAELYTLRLQHSSTSTEDALKHFDNRLREQVRAVIDRQTLMCTPPFPLDKRAFTHTHIYMIIINHYYLVKLKAFESLLCMQMLFINLVIGLHILL